jgi:2'-5' RNA ligase
MLPQCGTNEVRIGVAITIPEPYGSTLQGARASFGDPLASSIPPHITLLGPTVVAEDSLRELAEHLSSVAARFRPFVVRLRGTGTFQPVSPVVFINVVEGIAVCERVERSVRSGPLAQELRFSYHPHVTVAHELADQELDRAFVELGDFEASFVVSAFESYHHGDDGVWRPVLNYSLTGSDSDLVRRDAGRVRDS